MKDINNFARKNLVSSAIEILAQNQKSLQILNLSGLTNEVNEIKKIL